MIFVLLAQFVLVNVVVAVLMKHLEETHKQVSIFLDAIASQDSVVSHVSQSTTIISHEINTI